MKVWWGMGFCTVTVANGRVELDSSGAFDIGLVDGIYLG